VIMQILRVGGTSISQRNIVSEVIIEKSKVNTQVEQL
jgi:hypothetical protein